MVHMPPRIYMVQNTSQLSQPPAGRGTPGMDLALGGVALVAEYAAWRFGQSALAWLGALLLWLAIYDYSRERLQEWTIGKVYLLRVMAAILVIGATLWFVQWEPEGGLKLTFKDSPQFTEKRRKNIRTQLTSFSKYLKSLGVDITVDIPPMSVYEASHMFPQDQNPPSYVIFPQSNGLPDYAADIALNSNYLDDNRALTEAFQCVCLSGGTHKTSSEQRSR